MNELLIFKIWTYSTTVITAALFCYLFHRKKRLPGSKLRTVLPFAGYALFTCIYMYLYLELYVEIPIPVKLLLQIVITVLVAKCVYDMTYASIILHVVLFMALYTGAEMLVVQLWDIFEPAPLMFTYEEGRDTIYYYVQIMIYMFAGGFVVLAEQILHNREKAIEWREILPLIFSVFVTGAINLCITYNIDYVENDLYTAVFFICSLLIFVLLLYNTYSYSKRLEEKQKAQAEKSALFEMELQKNYYQQKLKDEERIREIYHDFKNHLLILESQNGAAHEEVIRELQKKVVGYEDYNNTGNEFLDIILKEKAGLARQEGIQLSMRIDYGAVDFMSALDISTIFGNLFDNAIEACRKVTAMESYIDLRVKRQNNLFVISMRNNRRRGPEEIDYHRTDKEDQELHGYGIKNIARSVRNYQGEYSIQQDAEEFQFYITIPVTMRIEEHVG